MKKKTETTEHVVVLNTGATIELIGGFEYGAPINVGCHLDFRFGFDLALVTLSAEQAASLHAALTERLQTNWEVQGDIGALTLTPRGELIATMDEFRVEVTLAPSDRTQLENLLAGRPKNVSEYQAAMSNLEALVQSVRKKAGDRGVSRAGAVLQGGGSGVRGGSRSGCGAVLVFDVGA